MKRLKGSSRVLIAGVVLLTMLSVHALGQAAESRLPIADGMKVTLEYTLAFPDNTIIESNVGKTPISYIQGNREILPGLEKALIGLKAGDKKHVTVPADEAYGQYDEKKKATVAKNQVPAEVKVGTRLRASNGMEATVVAVEPDSVVVDLNHPLAGKALVFDVNILKVEKQTPSASQ